MKVVDLITSYQTCTTDVLLDIVIGDAQIGSSVVSLEGVKVASGQVAALNLGKGSEIAGKTVKIKSVVTDVNNSSNKTSITYRFSCGGDAHSFQSKAEVDDDGDAIVYRAEFKLL